MCNDVICRKQYGFRRLLQRSSSVCMQVLLAPPVPLVQSVQREKQGRLERLERLEPLVGFAVLFINEGVYS